MIDKKMYIKPEISRVDIDNEICVILMSPPTSGFTNLPEMLDGPASGGPTAPTAP